MRVMKDSSKLLDFTTSRKLQFEVFRSVGFSTRRPLGFDPNRELTFDPKRPLPFGKHGVVFRQFACGKCNAVVTGEARKCPNCGAAFKSDDKPIKSRLLVELSEDVSHSKMAEYFGKDYVERKKEKPKHAAPRCTSCGNSLRYLKANRSWYCDRCKVYLVKEVKKKKPATQRPPQQRSAPQNGQRCSSCGNGLQFVPSMNRWYCNRCKVYAGQNIDKHRCTYCGNNIRYISMVQRWYCDRCRTYVDQNQQARPQTPPTQQPAAVQFTPTNRENGGYR